MTMIKTCCNTSVGIVITDPDNRLLMITRADGTGIAPVAGHALDSHPSWRAAAIAEVREETDLTVVDLTDTGVGGWRPNRCGRADPGLRGPGHDWRIYRATVTGCLAPDPRETRGASWYTPAEVQWHADRTIGYGTGAIAGDDWDAIPGLEAVWIEWLADIGMVTASRSDLAIADRLTRPESTRVWAVDFAAQEGRQVLYTDVSTTRRLALAGLLAEQDPERVISLVAATSPDGPRSPRLLRLGRIVGFHPYEES